MKNENATSCPSGFPVSAGNDNRHAFGSCQHRGGGDACPTCAHDDGAPCPYRNYSDIDACSRSVDRPGAREHRDLGRRVGIIHNRRRRGF